MIVRQRTILFDNFIQKRWKQCIFCPNWGIFYGTLLGKKFGECKVKKRETRSERREARDKMQELRGNKAENRIKAKVCGLSTPNL